MSNLSTKSANHAVGLNSISFCALSGLIESRRKIRFGIAAGGLRSVSFTVARQGGDVYVACRELEGTKHSFHQSGIHRFARNESNPRSPIESTTLPRLVPGHFWTVARVLYTCDAYGKWDHVFGESPRKMILIGPARASEAKLISLGFLPHHPHDHPRTRSILHRGCLKIADDKFLVITEERFRWERLLRSIFELHAPHAETAPVAHRVDTGASFVYLQHFRTKMNTYFYWAHHGIETRRRRYWFDSSKTAVAITSAHLASCVGMIMGEVPFRHLQRLLPDWREQMAAIRGNQPSRNWDNEYRM